MVLKEHDKEIILRYLNEGVSIKNIIKNENGTFYQADDSEIIRLFKQLGYNIVFDNGKYVRITKA